MSKMAKFDFQYFSIVILGNLNPQILNHDFLILHKIIPIDQSPFVELLKDSKKPFTDFVSTPVLVNLIYNPISLLINQNYFQARHDFITDPTQSPIISITKKYFELLHNTPINVCGFNFSGKLTLNSADEVEAFDKKIGLEKGVLLKLANEKCERTNFSFTYKWNEGKIEVSIPTIKEHQNQFFLNLNYEFPFESLTDFSNRLAMIPGIFEEYKRICNELTGEIQIV